MTVAGHRQFDALQLILEEQFTLQTEQLAELAKEKDATASDGYDLDTHVALLASTRQALADTTAALKRMADGTYGVCERCRVEIPQERLEALPHARFCVPCQGLSAP